MAPRSGTGYIGLDQWLSLNRPAAEGMAGKVVGGINTQGQKSQRMLDGSMEDFIYKADGNTLNFNEEDPGLSEALATKNAGVTYKGPTQLEGFGSFDEGRGIAEGVQADARLASDFYGRQALLQSEYGKGGGYSLGQQRLDSALMGAAGGDKIDAAKAQWGSLLGKYTDASNKAKTYATDAKANTEAAAKKYAGVVEGYKARAAEAQKRAEFAEGVANNKEVTRDAVARDQGRASDRAAVDEGRIPSDARKGGLGVDEWAINRQRTKKPGRYQTRPPVGTNL